MPGPYAFNTTMHAGDPGMLAWAAGIAGALNESTSAPTANVLVLRDASGQAQVATPPTADNDTTIATTAFVKAQGYAPLASPTFTGTPAAPTQAKTDSSTKIATTAFVQSLYGLYANVNAQTGTTYTPALTDQGDLVTLSNAAAITVTLPQDSAVAFPVGTWITFVGIGAGAVTFAAGTGATVNGLTLTAPQWSVVTAVKRAANTWVVDVATAPAAGGTSGISCAIPTVGNYAASQFISSGPSGKQIGIYNMPCFIDTGVGYTVDTAYFYCSTAGAAGDTAHVEIYARDAQGNIGSLLTNGATGTASVSAIGLVTCTFATACVLPAGGVFVQVKKDVQTGAPKVDCGTGSGPAVGVYTTASAAAVLTSLAGPMPLNQTTSTNNLVNIVALHRSA